MNSILDRVAQGFVRTQYNEFKPTTEAEFFALRLADKLGDAAAARHYADLADRYSEAQLLVAYRRAKGKGLKSDLGRSFHVELERLSERHLNGTENRRVAAIRIERRATAVAIFAGDHLEYPPIVRQLPTSNDKALASIASFVNWVREKCPFQSIALEIVPKNTDAQRLALTDIVRSTMSEQAVAIWDTNKKDVLSAFGYPAPRFRKEVRQIAESIWPAVNGSFGAPLMFDALALGLYCQVESLFSF